MMLFSLNGDITFNQIAQECLKKPGKALRSELVVTVTKGIYFD
jgi:hypothetical protein